ncbi:CNNM domain-containing protein [Botrimarina mediterranea]|uniref:CNNM transmembrane domain-containing protein n=1 Tax=Botrimarina mediterranea TaxID=2528022 RepID=A0A518KAM1_9BACT|nr:CNNM domain-containing protein [Botrimarina mediterranea]QDV74841.1 hypothetical protein Spa11_30500 [Botrimarina mediterranea]QDV79484.1 hypothetical protein K2D_30990 [Planctomycetes bacterium K2D]
MTTAVIVFCIGLALSAFFSGSETGYYRAPRIRLVVDAVGGDRKARWLLWASNHPEAFVSTALVGNNIANYLVSAAVVASAAVLVPNAGAGGEVAFTLLFTPVVFIFGELLPKRLFLKSPYKLMRRCGEALAVAGVILAIPTLVLWLISKGLSRLTGSSIQPLRMAVRRRELSDAFAEGQAVGLLSPAQRVLAQATFAVGGKPLREFMTPVARQPRLTTRAAVEDVLRLARRHQIDAWPVEPSKLDKEVGSYAYVRASRLAMDPPTSDSLPTEPLTVFNESTPFLQALTQLESSGQPMAAVVGAARRVTGYVYVERLQQALWDAV